MRAGKFQPLVRQTYFSHVLAYKQLFWPSCTSPKTSRVKCKLCIVIFIHLSADGPDHCSGEDKHVARSHPEDTPAQMRETALKINEWPQGQCVIILHTVRVWSPYVVLSAWWCHLETLFVNQVKAFNDLSAQCKGWRWKVDCDTGV